MKMISYMRQIDWSLKYISDILIENIIVQKIQYIVSNIPFCSCSKIYNVYEKIDLLMTMKNGAFQGTDWVINKRYN